jgi:hypothetical protein
MKPDHAIRALCGAPAARQMVVMRNQTLTAACLKARTNGTKIPGK